MKKTFVFCILFAALLALAACGAEEAAVNGSFTVIDADGNELFSAEGSVPEGGSACQEAEFPYTYADGMYDNFNGIASTADAGWLLYLDGELAETGADDTALSEGMVVEFRYLSYAEAYPEFY